MVSPYLGWVLDPGFLSFLLCNHNLIHVALVSPATNAGIDMISLTNGL